MNYLETAISYHTSGLKVIPFYKRPDGSVTFPGDYAKYRKEQSREDVNRLFSTDSAGIALLCTDGIEAIDIDVKHDEGGEITKQFLENLKATGEGVAIIQKCVIQRTKSKGWHIIYRTDNPDGNQKLTYRTDSKEAVIETRGKGGLLFVSPSPRYQIKQGDLTNIGHLTSEERALIFRCADELNEREEAAPPPPAPLNGTPTLPPSGQSPGDAYNAKHTVLDLAQRYGWTIVGRAGSVTRLNKPGASHKRDIHASIVRTKLGEERFYPFTTATAYEAEKCYSAFGMYSVEEHMGDFSAAARALAGQGYGDQSPPATVAPSSARVEEVKADLPDFIAQVEATRFDYSAKIQQEDVILHHYGERRKYSVGGFGQIGVLTGHEKSGKSFVLSCIAAAAIGRHPNLNFSLDLRGRKMLWFDTEQSEYFYKLTQKRIHDLAGKEDNLTYFKAYHLRKWNPAQRIAAIEHYVYQEDNLGVLVIDGIVDLLMNYNDLPEVQDVVQRLMRWTDEKKILLLSVLHVNKGDGKIRGHIGTEIKNKCDFVLSVTKQDETNYRIGNPTGRHASFPSFEFMRDDQGNAQYDDYATPRGSFPATATTSDFPTPDKTGVPASSRPGDDEEVPF